MRLFCSLGLLMSVGAFGFVACGGDSDSNSAGNSGGAAGVAASAGAGATSVAGSGGVAAGNGGMSHSAGASGSSSSACVEQVACTANPGGACITGKTACNPEACIDAGPAEDGTICPTGHCTRGVCFAPTAIAEEVNLTAKPLTVGRTCAEAPQFAVVSLSANGAKLASAPAGDCLVSGDEVLLINLQGATNAVASVGNWELLFVETVTDVNVTFKTAKTRTYGEPLGTDSAIGSGSGDQKVALIRVPRFGALSVAAGAKLTAAAWDGTTGGVIALRAASVDVQGSISAAALGYRFGKWSRDNGDCDDNVTTEAGESISGLGLASELRNAGAPGGIVALNNISFNGNTPISASAGHALAGEAGVNPNGRTLGEPGFAYGAADGSRMTLGSGASGSLTCETDFAGPALVPMPGAAGGIILLLTNHLNVGAAGVISATPPDASRDISGSGGTILIRGGALALGDKRVTALGSVARGVNGPTTGKSNKSSPGYVILQTAGTVTGVTDPPAKLIQ